MGAGLQTKKTRQQGGFSQVKWRATQSATPFNIVGGGTGIRTLDRLLTYAGFQDQCIQPLCHPSDFRSDSMPASSRSPIAPS